MRQPERIFWAVMAALVTPAFFAGIAGFLWLTNHVSGRVLAGIIVGAASAFFGITSYSDSGDRA